MRTLFSIIILVVYIIPNLSAQTPRVEWQKCYGSNDGEAGRVDCKRYKSDFFYLPLIETEKTFLNMYERLTQPTRRNSLPPTDYWTPPRFPVDWRRDESFTSLYTQGMPPYEQYGRDPSPDFSRERTGRSNEERTREASPGYRYAGWGIGEDRNRDYSERGREYEYDGREYSPRRERDNLSPTQQQQQQQSNNTTRRY